MTLPALMALLFSLSLLGAWMWARPTMGDRRRGAVRNAAMQLGLGLTTLSVPDLTIDGRVRGSDRLVTAYRRRDQAPGVPCFMALRTSGECGRRLPPGWQWQEGVPGSLPAGVDSSLPAFLRGLPAWVEAVGYTPAGWVLVFDERDPDQLSAVTEYLEELRALFRS